MKLKSLDTSNNYADFSLPVLALDNETGKGKWVEGVDVFVQMHNEFRQEFVEEKTAVEWDLETAVNPFEEYFVITKDSIEIKKSGFYELSIQLLMKGKAEAYIKSEVTKDNQLFGMRSVGIIDREGNLSMTLSRIIEMKINSKQEKNTLQVSLQKAAGQLIQLPYAASLIRIKKLKIKS
jgi:hypothetical protein